MNYYDELIETIEKYLEINSYDEARSLIEEELDVPYVPRDIERKLHEFLELLPKQEYKPVELDIDLIYEYLNEDKQKQLLAVNALHKMNLREHLDKIDEYLKSDGFINAKVLLIESLIEQEINNNFIFKDHGFMQKFNPALLDVPEESSGFKSGSRHIQEIFLKDPSLMKMASELLYKRCILALPLNLDAQEGIEAAIDIEEYIIKAFDSAK